MCGRRCRQKSDNLCSSGTLKNPICVHQRLAPAGVSLSQTLNSDLDTYWKSLSWIPKHVFPQSTSLSSLIVSAESDCVLSGEQHLPPERVRTTCLMIWRLFEVQQFVNLDGLKKCFRELGFGRFIIGLLTSAGKKKQMLQMKDWDKSEQRLLRVQDRVSHKDGAPAWARNLVEIPRARRAYLPADAAEKVTRGDERGGRWAWTRSGSDVAELMSSRTKNE